MRYTKATEKDDSKWSLSEFLELYGTFSIVCEVSTGLWYGSFHKGGNFVYTHIDKKVRGTAIADILKYKEHYEVTVACDEYCVYKRETSIDYSGVWEDSHPYELEDCNFSATEFFCDNPEIFDGEIL